MKGRERKWVTLVGALVLLCFPSAQIKAQNSLRTTRENQVGLLSEIHPGDRALLIVLKSTVVAADEPNRSIIDLVLKADPEPTSRHRALFSMLATKLNTYIRKYKSLEATSVLSDADFVIFFSFIGYRRILDVSYPFGELYIIVKGDPKTNRPPRVIWKSKIEWAADAIDDFLRDLKNNRGEF